jgi:hypothetical protein
MKMIPRSAGAALIALCAWIAIPAYASETIYIPASAAHPDLTDPSNNCKIESDGAFYAMTPAPYLCKLYFPITIPAGHTIQQIGIVHGDLAPAVPNPTTAAFLLTSQIPTGLDQKFWWSSVIPIPNNTLEVTPIMAQTLVPKFPYPDAFVVQSDTTYVVAVLVQNGSHVAGVQITYL